MRRVCVFCGSSNGKRPEYVEVAGELGQYLVENKLGLVYGGAQIGMMGALANAVLKGGGEVIGVIPKLLLKKEVAHQSVTELRVVESMHQRKALMERLSDAFIALPGGIGTFEELLEIMTWAKLGLHQKPIGLLNISNYFAPLIAMIDRSIEEGFMKDPYRELLLVGKSPEDLFHQFRNFAPLQVPKLLDRSTT
jgi:uncharacterized protein (TIGR00730 family)